MDPHNPNIDKRSTPQYALYQRENFWKSNKGEVPPFNTGKTGLDGLFGGTRLIFSRAGEA